MKQTSLYVLKLLLAGFLAYSLASIVDTKLPGSIEFGILGFTTYSVVGIFETLICNAQKKEQSRSSERQDR